jgi:hypothetical protein
MMRQANRLTTPGASAPSAWARLQVHETVPSGEKPKLGPTKGTIAAHADTKSARKPPRVKLSGALLGKVDRAGTLSESIGDEALLSAAGAVRGDADSLMGVSMDTSLIVSRS